MKAKLVGTLARGFVVLLLAFAGPAPAQAPSPPAQAPPGQLDQLVAPIALYPDQVLAQILMAATYPLEVVQADRWIEAPEHAALQGDQLAAAAEQQPWDPSVKSLVPFPQILRMMDNNLDWTERLGEAFVADQAAVMDSVQSLRQQAQAAGTLHSTPQDVVATENQAITIVPPGPEIVYVPTYDPNLAFGLWPYPDYPPFYFPGYCDALVFADFGFGWCGLPIIGPLWGWHHWHWHEHRLEIDRDHFARLNGNRPPIGGDSWQHDPSHRGGVPYRDPGLRSRFPRVAAPEAGRSLRGYPPPQQHQELPRVEPPHQLIERSPAVSEHLAPEIESYGQGAEVRAQAERGRASQMPAPTFRAPSPAPSFHPSMGAPSGGHGGHR